MEWRVKSSVILIVFLCLSTEFSKAQDQSYNCSHSYLLSSSGKNVQADGSSSQYCLDSCLQSSPALTVGDQEAACTLLYDILYVYNTVIPADDCLELSFSPGEYRLSSLSLVQVQYSVILRAPWGGVTLACGANAESVCEEQGGHVSPAGDKTVMIAFNGSRLGNMFVTMDSLSFQYCLKHLRFDALQELRIRNSSFV